MIKKLQDFHLIVEYIKRDRKLQMGWADIQLSTELFDIVHFMRNSIKWRCHITLGE